MRTGHPCRRHLATVCLEGGISMAQARDVVIVIVDISGYTRFMVAHGKAQAHAEMIVGALLKVLMDEVGECLEIAELEGDAIFMYAFKDDPESSSQRAVVLGQHL